MTSVALACETGSLSGALAADVATGSGTGLASEDVPTGAADTEPRIVDASR